MVVELSEIGVVVRGEIVVRRLLELYILMVVLRVVLMSVGERVQLVKMVLETSRGMMKIMRNEKNQAVKTARVTSKGCLIMLEYLHNKTAASTKAIQISNIKTAYAISRQLGVHGTEVT